MLGFSSMAQILDTVIISNDSSLAASLSSIFAHKDRYITVLEEPRLLRPDASNEMTRLTNVLCWLKPRLIIYAGQSSEVFGRLKTSIDLKCLIHVSTTNDIKLLGWGIKIQPDIASIKAAQLLHKICLIDEERTKTAVVCEQTTAISSVIAANYAIARGADFYQLNIPSSFESECKNILNTIGNTPPENKGVRLIDINSLKDKIGKLLPEQLLGDSYEKIMFVTDDIPYSIAIQDSVIIYAHTVNLGQYIAHNLYEHASGQKHREGPVGLFAGNIKMETEIEHEAMSDSLLKAKGIVKNMPLRDTKWSKLNLSTFPYDILYIATHGMQIEGSKNTYEIQDDKGNKHELVAKIAEGAGGTLVYIDSVDGATQDSDAWTRGHRSVKGRFYEEYVLKGSLPAPVFSEPTKIQMRQLMLGTEEGGMSDPIMLDRLAAAQRPLVVVNACGSWADLSSRFTYAGATAFIGTLWPIRDRVATEFAEKFFSNLFDVELTSVFNQAKNKMVEDTDRMAYVLSGTFESAYDPGAEYSRDAVSVLLTKLELLVNKGKQRIDEAKTDGESEKVVERIEVENIFLASELESFKKTVNSIRRPHS